MRSANIACALALTLSGCAHRAALEGERASGGTSGGAADGAMAPRVDHHQHLLSPEAAALLNGPPAPMPVPLPAEIARLLSAREAAWDDAEALAELFTEDALVLGRSTAGWIRGRRAVASYLSTAFARAFRLTPVHYERRGSSARVAGYYSREDGASTRHAGYVSLELERGADGTWRIASEVPVSPIPQPQPTISAEQLVSMLDAAGIRRAVVLSEAFFFDAPTASSPDAWARVRAENDWTARQVAAFPDRLVAFCSFNPLAEHALPELERCARAGFAGVKLHFGTSGVRLDDRGHVEKVRRVFAAANARGLALVVHVRAGASYGRAEAETLVAELLPAAPNVVVQIAHLWGGESFSDEALGVYARAVSRGDPRARRLYFDVAEATLAANRSGEVLRRIAERIREIGVDRILYGSDAAWEGRLRPRDGWGSFRAEVPLTDEELRRIAAAEAPYLQRR